MTARSSPKPATAPAPPVSAALAVASITALAALLRLWHFGQSPPGLNQDEAVNAWNAWCLLKTGRDMVGAAWPLFYAHAIGDNRTTLYFYALLPFQAIGGLSAITTRLPSAMAGILCVPLLYAIGRRLFGRACGLIAALVIAIDPWHLFMSRWGIEGGLCPFLALLPLALLAKSGLLPAGSEPHDARPTAGVRETALALAAGLAAGIGCYGYWPMRLYTPALLVLLVLLCGRPLWTRARERAAATLAFAAGFALTFGPLAWRHLTDPEIARRGAMTRLWEPGTPVLEITRRIAARFCEHFGPRFLFERGDTYDLIAPATGGALHLFMLPLLVAGLVTLAFAFRRSEAARLLGALVLAYPAGDLLARYDGVHALRSSPGIGALMLLAALGAVSAWRWLAHAGVPLARGAALVFAAWLAISTAGYLRVFFGAYNARPAIYHGFHTDLLAACGWLKPRLDAADAVFITTTGMNEPFAVTLVGLAYDPRRWLRDSKDVRTPGEWDLYYRYGKLHFMYGDEWKREADSLHASGRRVMFVVRPGEVPLAPPDRVIRRPDGAEVLWLGEALR